MNQKSEFHNLDNPFDGLFRDLAPGLTTRIFAGEQAMLSVGWRRTRKARCIAHPESPSRHWRPLAS